MLLEKDDVAAIAAALAIGRQLLYESGGCDHSVGICMCAELAAVERADEALRKIAPPRDSADVV